MQSSILSALKVHGRNERRTPRIEAGLTKTTGTIKHKISLSARRPLDLRFMPDDLSRHIPSLRFNNDTNFAAHPSGHARAG
jgi:hypothetical protein